MSSNASKTTQSIKNPESKRTSLTETVRRTFTASFQRRMLISGLLTIGLAGLNTSAYGQLSPLNLSDLNGSNGITLNGRTSLTDGFSFYLGLSVSDAGDINGDGIADFVIAENSACRGSTTGCSGIRGRTYVVFGSQNLPTIVDLPNLNGRDGFALEGSLNSITSVSKAGDINGDGIDDFVVGKEQTPAFGYVVFGRATAKDGDFPPIIRESELDGSDGFRFYPTGADAPGHTSVSAAGDVNGDGVDDFIIGGNSFTESTVFPMRSFVVFGRNTAQQGDFPQTLDLMALNGKDGFVLNGPVSPSLPDFPVNIFPAYVQVSGAGDINNDGVDDVVIGIRDSNPGGSLDPGQGYLVFGRNVAADGDFSASLDLLVDLNGNNGFTINSIGSTDSLGSSVSAAGDVNGDGVEDVLIGSSTASPGGRSSAGQGYVIFGKGDVSFPVVFELSSLNGENGFLINGIRSGDRLGLSLSGAGDLNSDGKDDIILGAPGADPDGKQGAGQSYVLFSNEIMGGNTFPAVVELNNLSASSGFVVNGISENDGSGFSVSKAGDVNGKGIEDLIIGAPFVRFFDLTGNWRIGQSYVLYGEDLTKSFYLLALGDINGDNSQDSTVVEQTDVTVKKLNSSIINQFQFSTTLSPVDVEVMVDINNNGAPEIVLLAEGSTEAEVRDSLTGQFLGAATFSPDFTPIDLEIIPDQNGNQIPELAVLQEKSGATRVEIRDALSGDLIKSVYFNSTFEAKDLAILPNVGGTASVDLAVLQDMTDPNQHDRVEIRDLGNKQLVHNVFFGKGFEVKQLEVLEDVNNNGKPELAVLRVGSVNVLVKDAGTGSYIKNVGFNPNFTPQKLLVVPDTDNDGEQELGLMARNPGNGQVKIELRDVNGGQLTGNVWYGNKDQPLDAVVYPDINGNGSAELGVLGRANDNPEQLRLRIKDAMTGAHVKAILF